MDPKELRRVKGLTLTQAARAAEVDPAALYRYEQGRNKPGYQPLLRLAAVYGVPPDVLYAMYGEAVRCNRERQKEATG